MGLSAFLLNFIPTKNIELIEAVKNNDIKKVKICLRTIGYPVNIQDRYGKTPLIYAAMTQNKRIAKLLLVRGANPNIYDMHHNTALFWAVRNPSLTKILLNKGANPNVANDRGRTPLIWAARYNQAESARLLLAHGAHINHQDKDGCTAALWAAEYRAYNTLSELKTQGANLNIRARSGESIQYIARVLADAKIAELADLHIEPNGVPHPQMIAQQHKRVRPILSGRERH